MLTININSPEPLAFTASEQKALPSAQAGLPPTKFS